MKKRERGYEKEGKRVTEGKWNRVKVSEYEREREGGRGGGREGGEVREGGS